MSIDILNPEQKIFTKPTIACKKLEKMKLSAAVAYGDDYIV